MNEQQEERSFQMHEITRDVFDSIPKKTPGRLTKMEFRCYALEQLKLVKHSNVKEIDNIFNSMDTNKNDELSPEEVKEYFDAVDKAK